MKALDRFVRNRKAVKADRATEQGIAGHQAAMAALNPRKGLKGIPVGISFEAAAALQNTNYERPSRFKEVPSPDDQEAFERYFSEAPLRDQDKDKQ